MRYFRLLIITFFFEIFFVSNLKSQVITGKVTDSINGRPIIGAIVKIKETKIKTITDADGKFMLKIDSKHKILIVEYLGYVDKEILIDKKLYYNIALTPDLIKLSEVVVVGYGTVMKADLTGSISSLPKNSRKSEAKNISESPNAISSGTLTAGEINDFSKWILWNDQSQEELRQHRKDWNLFPSTRFSVMVQNQDGFPMTNQKVVLLDKNQDTIWIAKTDNIGKAELWANMFYEKYSKTERFSIGLNCERKDYVIKKAKRFHEGINQITIKSECNVSNIVDAVFVVDATGSMDDEIKYLQVELNDVIQHVKENNSDLSLRLGSVFYRDHEEEYITRKSELSENISKTMDFIKVQSAKGGGDNPEAVEEALDVAINGLSWDDKARAKIIFLVLDAPPHQTLEILAKMQRITVKAAALGIKIVPIAGSGIDKSTEYLMRSLALSTNGTYVFLTDDSGIGDHHIDPTTDHYIVEKLNSLLIRLFYQFTSELNCKKASQIDLKQRVSDTTIIKSVIKTENDTITDEKVLENIQLEKQFSCKFYPNPTSGILNIAISGSINEIYLSDISGKILERLLIDKRQDFQINISNYPQGTYMLTYYDAYNTTMSGKIILTR